MSKPLPYTTLKEKKPILNRVNFVPANMATLLAHEPDYNRHKRTFSTEYDSDPRKDLKVTCSLKQLPAATPRKVTTYLI